MNGPDDASPSADQKSATGSRKPVSRRNFLKATGLTLGASVLVCSGLGIATTSAPQSAAPETPEFGYGKDGLMNERILVTYATRTGSTVGVAAAIGETLNRCGFIVDVKPIKENPSMVGYGSAVIGSAVNGGKWLPEAVGYVKGNRQALSQLPVALYSVHIMNLGNDEKSRANRLAYLNDVRPLLTARDEVFFAGIGFDPATQSRFLGWINRVFNIGPEGDCRDWNSIRNWAEGVVPGLSA